MVAGAHSLLLTFILVHQGQSISGNQKGYHFQGPSPTNHMLARGTPNFLPAGDQVFTHWSLQRTFHIETTTANEARLARLYSQTLSGLGKLGKQKQGWGLGDLCDMETFLVEKFGESSLCDSCLPVGLSWK